LRHLKNVLSLGGPERYADPLRVQQSRSPARTAVPKVAKTSPTALTKPSELTHLGELTTDGIDRKLAWICPNFIVEFLLPNAVILN
jgi:hypothetical protein